MFPGKGRTVLTLLNRENIALVTVQTTAMMSVGCAACTIVVISSTTDEPSN